MATITEPRAAIVPEAPRFVFDGVSWDDYEAMLRIVGDRRIRVNYDRGGMEIVSPLWVHGNPEGILGCRARVLVEELDIPCKGAGPVTFKSQELGKGIEPDRCFYLRANVPLVCGKRELVMGVDPPPDLIVEVDVTTSSIGRLPIFAALGIPEVWRVADEVLQFLHLQVDGTYQPRESSRAFPFFTVAEAARFLDESGLMDKTAWIKSFRAYVRDVLVPRAGDGH